MRTATDVKTVPTGSTLLYAGLPGPALTATQVILTVGSVSVAAAMLTLGTTPMQIAVLAATTVLFLSAGSVSIAAQRQNIGPRWAIAALAIDIAAILALRDSTVVQLPTTVVFMTLPAALIAANFRYGAIIASLSTLAVWAIPLATANMWPPTLAGLLDSLLPVGAIVLVVVATNLAAIVIDRQNTHTERLMRERDIAHRLQRDDSTIHSTILSVIDSAIVFYDHDRNLVFANGNAQVFADRQMVDLKNPRFNPDAVVLDERGHGPLAQSERVLLSAWEGKELAPHITWVGTDEHHSAYLAFSRQVRRPDGSPLGVLVVAHDVSDIVRSRRLRDDFLRIASHELRGPLTPLVGHLDLFAEETEGSLPEPAKERLKIVQESVERLVDRVRELLRASDVLPSLTLAPADIADVVSRAASGHAPKAASRGIDIALQLPESAVGVVDESQLAHAIGHVIDNAIKFSPENGIVEVECLQAAEHVEISVHDRGPGIPPADRERVFERFYRTEHAHKNAIQGFGLGLPAARAILSAHGGRIRITSRKGSGTTATLEVPVRI